jgi:hypothetical protein
MKRRSGLAALVLVVASVTGCSGATSTVAGAPAPVDDTPGSSTSQSGTAAPSPSAPTGSASPPATTTTPPVTGSARTLVLPPLVRDQIIAAWVAGRGAERGDVEGISPGTGYYGYMPSTGTYWATADFDPTGAWERKAKAAPNSRVALLFQDGPWVFSHKQGQAWRYLGDTGGVVCPPQVPAPMLAAWGLSTQNC